MIVAVALVVGVCLTAALYAISAGIRDFQRLAALTEEVRRLRAAYEKRMEDMRKGSQSGR